jgi:hypothetical protein
MKQETAQAETVEVGNVLPNGAIEECDCDECLAKYETA